MAPGLDEDKEGMEFVGKSGKLLWTAFQEVGLSREDVDIQNVVRCCPKEGGRLRDPTEKEIYCCSYYNERAIQAAYGKAAVHLVLGNTAAYSLFGQKGSSSSVRWDEGLNAYVVFARHPSYLCRIGATPRSQHREWYAFIDRLRAVKTMMEHPGRWGYLRSLDYKALTTIDGVNRELKPVLKAAAASGKRIACDIEDEPDPNGGRRIIMVGFAWGSGKPGQCSSWNGGARTIILHHPGVDDDPRRVEKLKRVLRSIMKSAKVRKVFQHGSYDVTRLEEYLGVKINGYDYDSQYAMYLRYPYLRSVSLETIATLFFPEFADYKQIMRPYYPNLSQAPLDDLVLYNCADADLTKRVESKTADSISLPLLQTYIWAAFTLERMEERGPILDEELAENLQKDVSTLREKILNRIHQIPGLERLDPSKQAQVAAALYDKMGYPQLQGRSTDKQVLEILANEYHRKNPFPRLVMAYRKLDKMENTYLVGYRASARKNGGEVRTIWWLTGAITGRLRSGRGDSAEKEGVVNLQNIHGNPTLKNILVSTPNWRKAINSSSEAVLDLPVFLQLDYSQAELRMLAEMSQDKRLLSQFMSGVDIHCQVGHELTGWPVERIANDQKTRRAVKNFHFGIVFGLSPQGGSAYMRARGIKMSEAQFGRFLDRYFQRYPGVKRYMNEQRRKAASKGYVETLFKFRRPIYEDDNRSTHAGNQAINSPIQGSAHQLLLIALAMLHAYKDRYPLLQEPMMEVHDALYFLVRLRDLPEAYKQSKRLLEKDVVKYTHQMWGYKLRVPLVAEAQFGLTLGTQVDYHGEDPQECLSKWRDKYQSLMKDSKLLDDDTYQLLGGYKSFIKHPV